MASILRSRSQSGASVPRLQEGGSVTRSRAATLQTPAPAKVKENSHDSRGQLPPYPYSNASTTVLDEKRNLRDVDVADEASAPKQGPPAGAAKPGPPGPEGMRMPPPGYSVTGQKTLTGYKLGMTIFVLAFGLFLSTLDSTIISTALVTISSELGQYNKASWVVVAYLLTYTSFLVVWTRLSDIFGRKTLLMATSVLFMVASIGCALSKDMNMLIVFRAIQGIGGSGVYALSYSSVLDVVPFRLMGPVSGAMSLATACSSVLGPVLGGLITSHTTWRWIFWINLPCGSFIFLAVFFIFPKTTGKWKPDNFRQIDVLGVLLSLAAAITLIVPLEEGGQTFAWDSIVVISLIVISVLCWATFAVWETYLTNLGKKTRLLPIFPMRMLGKRVIASTFVTAFLAGFPFMVVVVNLPQRFQIVNGMSPATAGLHMLPLLTLVAVGSFFSGQITAKFNVSFYLLASSSVMTCVGVGMISTLPTSDTIPGVLYFYQVILGFGFGTTLTALMVGVRSEVQFQDNAVATGAITQVRTLGGVLGLAVTQAIMIHSVKSKLAAVLPPQLLQLVLLSTENIQVLQPEAAAATRAIFANAINLEFRIVTGFSAAALGAALFTYRKKPFHVQSAKRVAKQNAAKEAAAVAASNSQDVEGQQHHEWNAESSQTFAPGETKLGGEEAEAEAKFYESKWDAATNKEVWSLTNWPIPEGHLFDETELQCPRCGYSIIHTAN